MPDPLQIGVRVESVRPPAWATAVLRELDAMPGVEVAWVAPAVDGEGGPPGLLGLLGRVDSRLLLIAPDPDARTHEPAGRRATPGRVDLVLDLGSTRRTAPAEAEVWRVTVDGEPASRLEPYFRALDDSRPVCAVAVEATLPDGRRRRVDVAHCRADRLSLARTRAPVLWKAVGMLTRAVGRAAAAGGPGAVGSPELLDASVPAPAPAPARVAAWSLRAVGRVAHQRLRKARGLGEWYLAVRASVPLPERVEALRDTLVSGAEFRRLEQPDGCFRADPFLFEHDGRSYLFFEEYRHDVRRAHIAVGEIGADGWLTEPVPCLVQDTHLSYPFVFEHEGSIYMLPESGQRRSVDLYRATGFPTDWTLDRTLLSGVSMLDATLVRHDAAWWLFGSVITPGAPSDDELWLFSAPSLDGPWTPHPQNPIVADIRCARPAGPLFRVGEELVRPAQNGSLGYGAGIALRRVAVLDADEYREEPLGEIPPNWLPHAFGTHTYARIASLEATDGRGSRPLLAGRRA